MNKTPIQERDSKLSKSDSKRPSQKLYVPKHLRSSNNNNSVNSEQNGNEESLNNSINKMNFDDPSIIGYISSSKTSNESHSNDENSGVENILSNLQTLTISSNNKNTKSQINETQKEKSPVENDNDNENEWYDLYDETGESVNSELQTNLSIPLRNKQINEKTDENKIDYLKFEPIENLNDQEFGHVIEIYEFPVSFKNENIYNSFKDQIGHQNFDIKWVDDSHCLGIFSSSTEASSALMINHALLKTRPLSKSGPEARAKAQRLLNTLKPYKARPQTTSFVATRLIGASLGINNLISKEKLRVEKSKLDSARTKHKKDKELKESIWQGQ